MSDQEQFVRTSTASKSDKDIVVIGTARTPMGKFGGTLRDMIVHDLGAIAIRAALERSGLAAQHVDDVIYANCRQVGNGPNPSRTAAVKAGIATGVPAHTVNMACPSAMKTLMLASQALITGESRVVVAGGMESMSTMPYILRNARWQGFKAGDRLLEDAWSDATDPLCGFAMGITAENLVEKYGMTRAELDEFALQSYVKAIAAIDGGLFDEEIVPVKVPEYAAPKGGATLARDETVRRDVSAEKLARLQPSFKEGGTVTAGNACSMGDGACALVVTTRAQARALGATPRFSIVSYAQTGCEPAYMGEGPGYSIPKALDDAGMHLSDIDYIEVNEAFAATALSNERMLGWDRSKVNVQGGAIALSHPTGISGGRIVVTLDGILRRNDAEFGIAAICGGGGVTGAMVIRREN